MLSHKYDFSRAVAIFAGVVMVVAIIMYFLSAEAFLPSKFSDGTISMYYPGVWHEYDADCDDEFFDCPLFVTRGEQHEARLFLIRFEVEEGEVASDIEEYERQYFAEDFPDRTITNIGDISIAGYPARIRDAKDTIATDGCADVHRDVYVVHEESNMVYIFELHADCQNWFDSYIGEVEDMYNNISFN